jgi:hypothetical protein
MLSVLLWLMTSDYLCVVCPSLIGGFWLPLCVVCTSLIDDFWLPLCVVCPLIDDFWLPLCVVCISLIDDFWLPLCCLSFFDRWLLITPLCCLSSDWWLLITSLWSEQLWQCGIFIIVPKVWYFYNCSDSVVFL